MDVLQFLKEYWFLILFVGATVAGYAELRWTVARHKKYFNGPFDRMKTSLAHIKTELAVIQERLSTHAEDIRMVGQKIEAQRLETKEMVQRVHDRIEQVIQRNCRPARK